MTLRTHMARFIPRGTTGIQDLIYPEVTGTPVAAMVFVGTETRGVIGPAEEDVVHRMIGAVGANGGSFNTQWISYSILDNSAGTIGVNEFRTDQITKHWDRTTQSFVASATATRIAGGLRLTWTYTGTPAHSPEFVVIFYYGTGVTAWADSYVGAGVDQAIGGLNPKIIFSSSVSRALNSQGAAHNWGFGVVDGTTVGTPNQGIGESTTGVSPGRRIHDPTQLWAGAQTGTFGYTLNPGGLGLLLNITSGSRSNEAVGFLVLDWNTGERVYLSDASIGSLASHDSLDDWNYSNVGFRPQLGGLFFSDQLTYGTAPADSVDLMGMSVTDGKGMTNQFCWSGGSTGVDIVGSGVLGYPATGTTHEFNIIRWQPTGFKVEAFDIAKGPGGIAPVGSWGGWFIETALNTTPCMPFAVGGQSNTSNTTFSTAFQTGFTIPATEFEVSNDYICIVSWTQQAGSGVEIVESQLLYNAAVIDNSRFRQETGTTARNSCMAVFEISQGTTTLPITLQHRSLDVDEDSSRVNHFRYLLIKKDSMALDIYNYENLVEASAITADNTQWQTLLSTTINSDTDDWILMGALRADYVSGTISPAATITSDFRMRVRVDGIVVSSVIPRHNFEDVQDVRPGQIFERLSLTGTHVVDIQVSTDQGTSDISGSMMLFKEDAFDADFVSNSNTTNDTTKTTINRTTSFQTLWFNDDVDAALFTDGTQITPSGNNNELMQFADHDIINHDFRTDNALSNALHTFRRTDGGSVLNVAHSVLYFSSQDSAPGGILPLPEPPIGETDNQANVPSVAPALGALGTWVEFPNSFPVNPILSNPTKTCFILYNAWAADNGQSGDKLGRRLVDADGNILNKSEQKKILTTDMQYFWFGEHQFATQNNNSVILEATNYDNLTAPVCDHAGYMIFDIDSVAPDSYYFDTGNVVSAAGNSIWETLCTINVAEGGCEEWILMGNPYVGYSSGQVAGGYYYNNGVNIEARIKVNGIVVGPTIKDYFTSSTNPPEQRLTSVLMPPQLLEAGPQTVTLEIRVNLGLAALRGALVAIRKNAIEGNWFETNATNQTHSDTNVAVRNVAHMVFEDTPGAQIRSELGLAINNGTSPSSVNEPTVADNYIFATVIRGDEALAAGTQNYAVRTTLEAAQSLVFKLREPAVFLTHSTDALLVASTLETEDHTTDALLGSSGTVFQTTDALLQASLTEDHTTDALLKATFTEDHTTDALLQASLTEDHTTDALLKATFAEDHTTDALLQASLTEDHTTDALLGGSGVVFQTTDALLQAAQTEDHATDALLKATETAFHTTDALFKATFTEDHTTDSLLQASLTEDHTTDTLLKATQTVFHTTDALLKATQTESHTTDALLGGSGVVFQTTDSLLQATQTEGHTTDALLKATFAENHTTDALLQASLTEDHTTDALLGGSGVVFQTTDALLQASLIEDHTTDALLQATFTEDHTTDTLLQATFTEDHTTDALLKATQTVFHTTDALLKAAQTESHTTDSLLVGEIQRTHTTDTLLGGDGVVFHTTDALLLAVDQLRPHNTDALLKAIAIESHDTDALLKATATAFHTTDSLLIGEIQRTHATDSLLLAADQLETHTTDSLLVGEIQRTHTTDALLGGDGVVFNSTDSLLIGEIQRTHATDSLLQATEIVSHSTDSLLIGEIQRTHTTDSLLVAGGLLARSTDSLLLAVDQLETHTTDALLQATFTASHSTDALLGGSGVVFQTTDTLLSGTGVTFQTTDTLLEATFDVLHTTDALLQATFSVLHTTDALLGGSGTAFQTTDALLQATSNQIHSTDSLLKRTPVGIGDQSNINFTTTNAGFVTGYTIQPVLFEANKNYMLFVSYTQRSTNSNEDVATRLRFNGATIPRSEFTNSSPVSVQSNGYYMGQITQGPIPAPIEIQIAYQGGGSQSAVLDNVRWFAIELDSLLPSDYVYAENAVPTDVPTFGLDVVQLNFTGAGEDWIFFYCLNAEDTIGSQPLINPNGFGAGVLTRFNYNNQIVVSGPSHKFESIFDNKSQSFMQFVGGATVGFGARTVRLNADKTNAVANTLSCTGSIFAIKMDAIGGEHQFAGAPTSLIQRTLTGNGLVWNVGWNSDDAEVISNSSQLGDPGTEIGNGSLNPFNFDWRSDNYVPGTYDFEFNGTTIDDKRHAVFAFAPPALDFVQHSTDAMLNMLGVFGHATDALLFQAFAVHSLGTFLQAPNFVNGTGNIALGEIKGEGVGVVSKFAEVVDPSCINRRILSKYGWTPTKTRTTGFKSCQIKR